MHRNKSIQGRSEAIFDDNGVRDDDGRDWWEVVARNDGEKADGRDWWEVVARRERKSLASFFFGGLWKVKYLKDMQMPTSVRMGMKVVVEMDGRW